MRRRFFASAVLALSALFFSVPGCSGEGEGQRCDINDTDTQDCAGNLTCQKALDLGGAAAAYAIADGNNQAMGICCPSDRTQATTSICAPTAGLNNNPPADSGPPACTPATDAGSSDAGSGEGGSDAGAAAVTCTVPDAGPDTSPPDASPDSSTPDASPDSSTPITDASDAG